MNKKYTIESQYIQDTDKKHSNKKSKVYFQVKSNKKDYVEML